MYEERCLSHGCAMQYDYKSGFTLCPQCEENESLLKCGCCKENGVSEPTSRFCTVCLRRFEEIANANKAARYFD